MGTFGDRLRREREMRGVSLDEIATATKIGTRSLKALEDEEFSKLPGGIFNKGFVRAYARFLGIDEDQAVADYVAAAGAQEQSSEAVIVKLAAETERRADEKRIQRQRESAEPPFTWNTVAIVVVIAVAAVLGWQYYAKHRALKAQQASANAIVRAGMKSANTSPAQGDPAANASEGTAQSSPAPVLRDGAISPASPLPKTAATTNPPQTAAQDSQAQNEPTRNQTSASTKVPQQATAPETATAAGVAQEFVVVVRARKRSWLSSLADGASHTARLLPANGEATFHARNTLRLTVGNAGGVEISFNGRTLPLVGEENKSKILIFTPDGLQQ